MEDNGDEKDASKRKNRNLSEKKRRDQFNILVNELSDLISNNNRKMDKSTILRSTISFLKIHNEVKVQSRAHDVQEDWKPAFLSNEEFIYLVLEALDGFIMVFSANGRIHYTSESITSLLGHNPAAIVNKNIYDMMHKDDQQHVINLLQRSAATNLMENQSTDYIIITFQVHIRRGCLDSKEEVYDVVQFYGHFRTHQEPDNERDVMEFRDVESRSTNKLQLSDLTTAITSLNDDRGLCSTEGCVRASFSGAKSTVFWVLFVCIGSLCTPKLIRDVSSLVDSNRSEFTSRHSLEWKFLFLDHRAPPIIGYLPFEVLGTSGYDYYHFDDLEKVVTCHEALMEKGELTSCYYRFLTKGQQWIWLQTRYFITYHQWNSKPEFVVCTHRVVSYADVISAKDFVELDTEFNESAIAAKERLVKDPLPTLSPLYHISEANNDAFDNVYPSTSQDNITGLDIYQNHGKTSTTKPLFYISPRLYPQPLHPPFPSFQVPVFKVTDHFLVPPPLPLESVAPPFPESQVPVSQIEALQPLPPQSMSPQFPAFQFEAPQPLPPQSMSPQFPAFQVPEPPNLASDRPESTMSSLSVLEANYTGQFLDPPLQPASVKRASASSKIRDTIAQAAVPTSDTWHRAQVRYADGSDSSVSGESRTSQRTSDREAHIPPPTQSQPLQPLQTAKQECMVTPQHEMDAQYLELTTSPPRDQTQILEQLQRKHEELQQMIARQQEELRKVKEQLALARLGILQPLINVPESSHPTQEELQNQEPNNSAQSPLPQLAVPSTPTQPPQQPHSEHQQKPQ